MKTKDYWKLFEATLNNNNICRIKPFNLDKETFESLNQCLQENNITKIAFRHDNIGGEGPKFLAGLLQTNSTITSIDLWNNKIGDEELKFLAEALKTNKTLTSIGFGDNKIGAEGVKFLAEALKTNKTLTSIDLRCNKIGDEGLKFLAGLLETNSTITSINLWNNKIGTKGAKFLAEALKINSTITSIELGYNNNIRTKLIELIKGRLEENEVICQDIDDNCKIISRFNNFDQFKTVNIKANKLLAKKIADILMSITSEDLQKFYQENKINDLTFYSYQEFLLKNTNEGELIKQAFQQYHHITEDFVSFLKIAGFTKQHCSNLQLDFDQQVKFYENLAHSPIKIIFACFKDYTLEDITKDLFLIHALAKICQQLDSHKGNSAFMELAEEVSLFKSIINSEIVFEGFEQNEILQSNIDIEIQLKKGKEEKEEKEEEERIKEKDQFELEEREFIDKEIEKIDQHYNDLKMKEEKENKNNINEKEDRFSSLFEDSSEEDDHQVNKMGEIHEIHESFDN